MKQAAGAADELMPGRQHGTTALAFPCLQIRLVPDGLQLPRVASNGENSGNCGAAGHGQRKNQISA
jgi:hypothetical protein